MNKNVLIWFRNDLRIRNNDCLKQTVTFKKCFPIYIDYQDPQKNRGAATNVWLNHALSSLNKSLHNTILKRSIDILEKIIVENNIKLLCFEKSSTV